MSEKIKSRKRRSKKTRASIKRLGEVRLSVHRTLQHIYAQVIAPCGTKVLAQATSLDKEVRDACSYGGNKSAAEAVGQLIAKRSIEAGVKKVAFDRSGYKYHGRVKALADAARAGGMEF